VHEIQIYSSSYSHLRIPLLPHGQPEGFELSRVQSPRLRHTNAKKEICLIAAGHDPLRFAAPTCVCMRHCISAQLCAVLDKIATGSSNGLCCLTVKRNQYSCWLYCCSCLRTRTFRK